MSRGPCAKLQVECDIWHDSNIVGSGTNDCANPQETCPRLPGEGYEKCKSICQQGAHAEVKAIADMNARNNTVIGSFKMVEAHVYGHWFACRDCCDALKAAGVDEIVIHVAR